MGITCIARRIGVGVLVVSLHAGAQAPEGKGRPQHAGASPFIRFPVPQRSVGVLHQTELKAFEISSPKAADARAVRAAHTGFAMPAEPPAAEKKGPLRECGTR